MGYELFLVLLNMSLTGALTILAVLVVRLFLRRAPKMISYCLWAVVLFKLLCPVSFSLPVSLPGTEKGPVVESGIVYYIPRDILYGQAPAAEPETSISPEGEENAAVSGGSGGAFLSGGTGGTASGKGRNFMGTAMAVWGVGAALMLAYGGGSVIILRGKLKEAKAVDCGLEVKCRAAVYEKRNLPTPFVLGIFRPKIYLPTGLSESEKQYILLHEQIHIRRGDHVVKVASFLALCIHWFNPVVWAAFFVSERDMEMSCDEAVLRKLGPGVKKEYSAALLNLAVGRRIIGGMPLAFGEGTPGSRVRNVLKYKKPQVAAVCAGIVLAGAAAVLLLANPRQGEADNAQEAGVENFAKGEGYEGAVWDDMDDHADMVYLVRESNISELERYLEKKGWRNADIEEVKEHLPSLADWIAEYQLPKEEKLQADAFSAIIGYGGGQTFQWIAKDLYTVAPGEWCPEEWKAAAVIFQMDGESLVFDTDGILEDVMFLNNHSGIVTEPVPVESCEEQAVLVQFECDLFTAAEFAEAQEAGMVTSEEDITGHFWYVCFGRKDAPCGYVAGLNMRYFDREEAVEFARSIRFTEEAWR